MNQLSPGYNGDFVWENGTDPNGRHYDIVMKKITDVNHLALLPAERGGTDAVILDSAPKARWNVFVCAADGYVIDGEFEENKHPRDKGKFTRKESTEETEEDSYPEKDYSEYKGKGQKAIDFLVKNKGGQVKEAFTRSDIDIVYGSVTDKVKHTGYGLAHIIDKWNSQYPFSA